MGARRDSTRRFASFDEMGSTRMLRRHSPVIFFFKNGTSESMNLTCVSCRGSLPRACIFSSSPHQRRWDWSPSSPSDIVSSPPRVQRRSFTCKGRSQSSDTHSSLQQKLPRSPRDRGPRVAWSTRTPSLDPGGWNVCTDQILHAMAFHLAQPAQAWHGRNRDAGQGSPTPAYFPPSSVAFRQGRFFAVAPSSETVSWMPWHPPVRRVAFTVCSRLVWQARIGC